jgi:uncharacterized protein (TIGR00266 family)
MSLVYEITKSVLPVVTITLKEGDVVYSESGGMSWMSGNVEMKTHSGGGLGKMLKRKLSGESLFITDYFVKNGTGTVAFASEFPGRVVDLHLGEGESVIAQKDGFMCAEKSVDLDIHLTRRFGAGFFGGEGFIMEKVTGPGIAFFEFDGDVVEMELADGEELQVDAGHVAMFQPSVSYNVRMVKGLSNILFGGEGLFLATLRGPGKVWLQTMPMYKIAGRLLPFLPLKRD